MTQSIEEAIKVLTDLIKPEINENSALKFTQAALNLANAKATLAETKRRERESNPQQ